jgi:hypothetical protein
MLSFGAVCARNGFGSSPGVWEVRLQGEITLTTQHGLSLQRFKFAKIQTGRSILKRSNELLT